MYTSKIRTPHNLPMGEQVIHGVAVQVGTGYLYCETLRIQKRLARVLSIQFGEAELEWSNEKQEGTCRYVNGNKQNEVFNNNRREDKKSACLG